MHAVADTPPLLARLQRYAGLWPGLALVAAIAGAGILAARLPALQALGLSALTLAIVFGIALGNTVFPAVAARSGAGVDFAKGMLLRTGIVLYGFRVTFQDIAAVGMEGVLIAVAMVGLVFGLAVLLGTRVFKLDRETAMLIGAGSAICGAAAVMATEPVVRGQAHKVSVAVATVVVFGTLGMFLYPWLYPYLGLGEHAFGVYAGSTIHEVAQVVVAGRAVGEAAGSAAVIEKMLRVMLLAPFLLLLSSRLSREANAGSGEKAGIVIPWFAVLFVAVAGVNSLQLLPAAWVEVLVQADTVLLAMAMAALGLRTHVGAIRQAGLRPLLLASALFVFLLVGGYAVNVGIGALFASAS
ncbi:YeiH family protein [Luteimonas mephitis]|uniref:YeiH family protein n=1 Tax=Luteimonas mephitis TaxID=83615 RepID=UPI00041B1D9C|nr:YeiH family protein [Luteimonas mephitis]